MKDSWYFYDPKHGGCLRLIRKVDNFFMIDGAYGSDEGKKGHWFAIAKKLKNNKNFNLEVSFTYKSKIKHIPLYKCNWINREIHWEDGNVWKELYW